MRIQSFVIAALFSHPGIGHIEIGVWLLAYTCRLDSVTSLVKKAGLSRARGAAACEKLVSLGWLRLLKMGRKLVPVAIIDHSCQTKLVELLHRNYALVGNRGEFLVKCYLDIRVFSDDYVDNARPGFLVNPITEKLMEYDRYDPEQRLAIEYNGPQHYQATAAFPDESAVKDQHVRDLLKQATSANSNVRLVIVETEGLSPEAIDNLLPKDVPRRYVDKEGPYYRALSDLCARYRKVGAGESRERSRPPDVVSRRNRPPTGGQKR